MIIFNRADLGAAAHRVRLFWTNMLQPAEVQSLMPKLTLPCPSLQQLLKPHHIPTKPGHADRAPFATHNKMGGPRLCMPTVVSYLNSNAYRTKDNGNPGEGQLYNTLTD